MTTRFPLSITVHDGTSGRDVTYAATNVRWSKTAPGGHHSMSADLKVDPSTFGEFGAARKVWICGPTGDVLFEGFLDNPGQVADQGGVGFELSAMGTVVLASDRAEPLIYVDRSLEAWEPFGRNFASANAGPASNPTDDSDPSEGLITGLNRGQPVAQNAISQIGYTAFVRAGWQFGAISGSARSGKNDSDYLLDLAWSPPSSAAVIVSTLGINTSTNQFTRVVGEPGHPVPGSTAVALRLRRSGTATTVADDNTWTWWSNLAVLGRRMDRFGTLVSGAAGMQSATHVRSDWVAEDLLGRLLSVCDKTTSTVDPGSFLIDQLNYSDGATAADVLDDLLVFEPDFLWEMLHATSGGYVFNFRRWPTTVRYEVSTKDGYDAPGAEFDLCNRVLVKWTDAKGISQTTTVTSASSLGIIVAGVAATVANPSLKALEDAGRIRDAEAIALPDGRGSAANALRAGQQLLALKADPPKAATVVVKRPIADLLRGGSAMPYEIEPGYLVHVRETGDILRLTEVEVDDEAGTATLTLGEPIPTAEQRLARLENTTRRRAA